jgi:DNA-binding transcriptional regulator YiaG
MSALVQEDVAMGFNAVYRVFGISKNTLLNWERRFADLQASLLIYAFMRRP